MPAVAPSRHFVAPGIYVNALVLLASQFLVAAQQNQCSIGGSTRYCGYTLNKAGIAGGSAAPCKCHPSLCCSAKGFCGPEPPITTDAASAYCGNGCQSDYGSCNPGKVPLRGSPAMVGFAYSRHPLVDMLCRAHLLRIHRHRRLSCRNSGHNESASHHWQNPHTSDWRFLLYCVCPHGSASIWN